jgi:hypothetical protein
VKGTAAKQTTGKKSAGRSASHSAAPKKAHMVARKAKPAAKKAGVAKKAVVVKKAVVAKTSRAAAPVPRVAQQPRSKQQAAVAAGMYLSKTDAWTAPYFTPGDLHCIERELFG